MRDLNLTLAIIANEVPTAVVAAHITYLPIMLCCVCCGAAAVVMGPGLSYLGESICCTRYHCCHDNNNSSSSDRCIPPAGEGEYPCPTSHLPVAAAVSVTTAAVTGALVHQQCLSSLLQHSTGSNTDRPQRGSVIQRHRIRPPPPRGQVQTHTARNGVVLFNIILYDPPTRRRRRRWRWRRPPIPVEVI